MPPCNRTGTPEIPQQHYIIGSETSAQSAGHAALFTTELLEMILLKLTIRDLLFAQKVCTKWQAVIQKSVPLQQALFLLPREANFAWVLRTVLDDDPEGSGLTILTRVAASYQKTADGDELWPSGNLNPLFFDRRPDQTLFDIALTMDVKAEFALGWQPVPVRPEASCRRMLISQPPVRRFAYSWRCRKRWPLKGSAGERDTVDLDHDATIGDVMDLVTNFEQRQGGDLEMTSHHLETYGVLYPSLMETGKVVTYYEFSDDQWSLSEDVSYS